MYPLTLASLPRGMVNERTFPHRLAHGLFVGSCLALMICFGLTPYSAQAQTNPDGSLYSRFGVGELRSFPSSQLDAMGGAGTGTLSLNYLNHDNPASWGYQVLTRASGSLRYQNVLIEDAAGNSSQLQGATLNSVEFSFPILSRRMGMAFSFAPYSRMNYSVQQTGELTNSPLADEDIPFQTTLQGSGGLQQLRGGLGYRITDNLSVGANASMIFGILEQGRETLFGAGAGLEPSTQTDATRLRGFTGTLGAIYAVEGLRSDNDMLSFGASFTLPTRLTGELVETIGFSLDRDTLRTQPDGQIDLPYRMQAGAAYQPNNRWYFVADALYEPWTSLESTFQGFPEAAALSDRVRLSAGAEVTPAGTDDLAPFFQRVSYRLGAYWDDGYATPVGAQDISTLALTGGLSLPTMTGGTRLDLSFSVGRRGTTDNDLVRDTFYTLSATLNIGERWFLRRQLR